MTCKVQLNHWETMLHIMIIIINIIIFIVQTTEINFMQQVEVTKFCVTATEQGCHMTEIVPGKCRLVHPNLY